jgi:hypothetical protein
MAKGSSLKKEKKEEEDIRIKFNKFIDEVISKGKTSSVRFDANFLKELEKAGEESQLMRKAKPVKIIQSKILTKPAITQALNLASNIEMAATKNEELNLKKWVEGGK